MAKVKRLDIKQILKNPVLRQEVVDGSTDFICKVEGIRPSAYSDLLKRAKESPELERIRGDVARHKAAGRHDPARTVHSIERYVVEPSAIALAASQDGGESLPWFRLYGREVRAEVARHLAEML